MLFKMSNNIRILKTSGADLQLAYGSPHTSQHPKGKLLGLYLNPPTDPTQSNLSHMLHTSVHQIAHLADFAHFPSRCRIGRILRQRGEADLAPVERKAPVTHPL